MLAVVVGGATLPLACGASNDPVNGSGSGTGNPAGGTGTGGLFNDDAGIGTLVVTPAEATIVVTDGVSTPVDLEATKNGVPVAASWVADYASIADVDAEGLVTATNVKGGEVRVTATKDGSMGSSLVTVRLQKLLNPAGATTDQQVTLKGASNPDPATQWTYPYDRTVFPKGLLAPELMWNGGGGDDLYYVHFVGEFVDFEIFTTAAPPSRFALDLDNWRQLTESGKGGTVKLTVARLTPGATEATVVVNHTWTIARGSLRGTVYYWSNNLGRIVRIQPGADAPEDFLAAAGISDNCSTCHTVSANGSTLVIGGDVTTSTFDLIQNTGALSILSVGKPVRNWAMPAVSRDGKVLVENNAALPGPPGGSDGMWETYTGTKITGTGLDGVLLDMPAFGPAGTMLAFVTHEGTHDLGVFAFDEVSTAVSSPITLVPAGADPNLNCIAFPSMSPTVVDGELGERTSIVYHRGAYPGSLDTRTGPGSLYLASADQAGIEVRLAEANGDSYPFAAGDRDRTFNYEPTFAPVVSGGYAWVVFTSRRTYGNRLVGGPTEVKQLWVTAIDLGAEPGTDPSHPAFWVPGQDLGTLNMRGYWALNPCIHSGESCQDSSECCNGNCVNGVCEGPDPDECAENGDICTTKADCCEPTAECNNGECGPLPPQ
jgi:hypothetical protein